MSDTPDRPVPDTESAFERGLRIRRLTHGDEGEARRRRMERFCPDIARYMTEFAFGEIFARPGLDLQTRELLAVAAHITRGDLVQIEIHIKNALNVGCTPQQIIEVAIEMMLYRGFPAMYAGATTAMKVFEARGIWNETEGWLQHPDTPWKGS